MNSLQIEYTKFLLQNSFSDIENTKVQTLLEFYKREEYPLKNFSCGLILIDIDCLYKKVIASRQKGGLFLSKINDSNFIKLNEYILNNFNLGIVSYRGLYKEILKFKRQYQPSIRLYDIKKDSELNLFYGITVECLFGNYTFRAIPLEKILFCYNTTRYWIS